MENRTAAEEKATLEKRRQAAEEAKASRKKASEEAQSQEAEETAALDNLIKGASGQGVECFNIAFGFDRTTALEGPAQWP